MSCNIIRVANRHLSGEGFGAPLSEAILGAVIQETADARKL